MDIKAWMRLKGGLTLKQVAEMLAAVDPPLAKAPPEATIMRHINGDRLPRPELIRRYLVITERAVGPNDWHELSLVPRDTKVVRQRKRSRQVKASEQSGVPA